VVDVDEHTVANRLHAVEDKLFLAQPVKNMRAAILGAGAATVSELDALEDQVARAARAPENVFFQARIHQVSGRRPEAPRQIDER
jgi:hypothetical protein